MIKSFLIAATFVTATIYHAVEEQTDDTPLITASLQKINPDNPLGHRWIAVSRDLEAIGYTFGTKVCVMGTDIFDGDWTVQDRMNSRWSCRIDFLVNTDVKGGKWENVLIEIVK
jgi:hypothetical protein